jgi:hypothetical protein
MPQSAMQKGRLTILAGCTVALVVTLCALRADVMVGHAFSKAFGTQGAPQSFDATALSGTLRHAGDHFSLTSSEDGVLPPFAKQLAVGDRITISGRDRRERVLVVVDIKPLVDPITRIASDSAPQRMLVICRLVGGSNDADQQQARVEFVIQGQTAEPATLPPAPAPKA